MEELFNSYVRSLKNYIMFRIKEAAIQLTPELTAKNRAPIFLSMGAPTTIPPKYVMDKLVESLDLDGIHTYSNPKGEMFLIEAIAEYMKRRFGVDLSPKDEIISLIGSKEGISNLFRALTNPRENIEDRDIFMIPDPGYTSYREMVKAVGARFYSVPLLPENNYMPNLDDVFEDFLKKGNDPKKIKALVINYQSNPLGATCTLDYLKHAVEFCTKHKILLISDAAYCDLYFEESEKPHSVFEVEGATDIAVEFFTFSKPYAITGWRAGWVCGNSTAVGLLAKLKSSIDTGIFKGIQKACAEIINSKEGDDYIKWANDGYKHKQRLFLSGLEELGWPVHEMNVPQTTFYLWLPIPRNYQSSKLFAKDLLEKSGVVVVPGYAYGEYGEGFFRISIVCCEEELHEVIERMKKDGFYY